MQLQCTTMAVHMGPSTPLSRPYQPLNRLMLRQRQPFSSSTSQQHESSTGRGITTTRTKVTAAASAYGTEEQKPWRRASRNTSSTCAAAAAGPAPAGSAAVLTQQPDDGTAAAVRLEQQPELASMGADTSAQGEAAANTQPGAQTEADLDEPYSLVQKVALAGGVLDVVRLEGKRMLRIWTPPGYSRQEAARHPYPMLVLNDGQNLFSDELSFSGCSWRAAETAAQLIASGQLPPFLIAGIDHAGPQRSNDYLPYKPGTGPGSFRKDAADWPGGGVAAYMARVVDETLPWLQQEYGAATDAAHLAFGGSSFGGICALWACMHYSDRFGAALVESPSLWFADERFLREDLQQYTGPWPERLWLGMGDKEYSGTRAEPGPQWDELLVGYCQELAELLESKGLDSSRLQWQVGKGAAHTEAAWAERLPEALTFLLQPWWKGIEARHSEALYFTSPRKLRAGLPATLFVQKARSHVLAGAASPLQVQLGFNNWTAGSALLQLQPAPQLRPAQQQQQQQEGEEAASGEAKWQAVSFTVPPDAYEMLFALSDGHSWDNNAGNDFYVRVKLPSSAFALGQSPEALLAAAKAAAEGPVDETASRSGSKLFFTAPEVLVAGAPAVLYFNRGRSWSLQHNPNVKAHLGFNDWDLMSPDLQLAPTSLWRGEGVDWWATQQFQVPAEANELSFAFCDGHGAWDNNDGHNYSVPVLQPQRQQAPRGIASMEVVDHASGKLHIINLSKRAVVDKASKEARWTEEKVLRVWTPPGYSKDSAPPGGWPVLIMNDGSNKFEDWLAHQGHAWNVGHCAAGLIANGTVPPFLVVGIDSAGPMRSLNYLPYKPGTGLGGFRGDAERWPGGGCEGYMRRVVHELLPLITETFGTATDPAKVAFGGGSFAGVTALYAAMHYPHVFGAVLAESPSLWIAEGLFLRDLWAHKGALPERIFFGCGTREYSATRDHEREDVDALLLYYCQEAARALGAAGMRGGRLAFQVEEGAGHHELAWKWRLTGALTFLLSPWWDE